MQFEFQGRKYNFNQLFDGWRLAIVAHEALVQQQPQELKLHSGETVMLRHGDIANIVEQVTAPAPNAVQGEE